MLQFFLSVYITINLIHIPWKINKVDAFFKGNKHVFYSFIVSSNKKLIWRYIKISKRFLEYDHVSQFNDNQTHGLTVKRDWLVDTGKRWHVFDNDLACIISLTGEGATLHRLVTVRHHDLVVPYKIEWNK